MTDSTQTQSVSQTPPDPAQVGDLNIAPTTTHAEDRTAERKGNINLMWESTQAFAAKAIIATALVIAVALTIPAIFPNATEKQIQLANLALLLISSMTNLVMGFYFGRTNHTKSSAGGNEHRGE